MKSWYLLLVALLVSSVSYADENVIGIPSGLEVKQGFIIPWENPDSGFSNMSTVSVLKTKASPEFGKWNALWDGWSLDAAWSYDANTSNVGVMLGRKFGTLGDYLPIEYPLADKMDITLYPLGVIITDPVGKPEISGASGAAFIKFDVSF